MANVGGRPTKFSPQMVESAAQYLADAEDVLATNKKGEKYVSVCRLPTLAGLARHLRVHRTTVWDWSKIHPELQEILEDIKTKQEEMLIHKGLAGQYNPTIAKVLLAKHGYREGIEHTGGDGGPLRAELTAVLDKVYGH